VARSWTSIGGGKSLDCNGTNGLRTLGMFDSALLIPDGPDTWVSVWKSRAGRAIDCSRVFLPDICRSLERSIDPR